MNFRLPRNYFRYQNRWKFRGVRSGLFGQRSSQSSVRSVMSSSLWKDNVKGIWRIMKGILSKTNYSSNPTSCRIFIKFATFNQHYKRKHQTGISSWCHCLQGAAVAKNVNRTSFLNVAIFFVVTSLCIFSVNMI